ncbi:MAG: hypothetical protein ACREV8_00410 [Gammaproteobacteria bacterium]
MYIAEPPEDFDITRAGIEWLVADDLDGTYSVIGARQYTNDSGMSSIAELRFGPAVAPAAKDLFFEGLKEGHPHLVFRVHVGSK